jgi:GNAT superfamily N-acetyltransferase
MCEPDACEMDLAARALAWSHRVQEQVCNRIEPWEHGTVYRSARHPRYFTANLVAVRDDPVMSVNELIAVADTALAGLAHRRIDFDRAAAAEPLRDEFAARGFQSTRLVWMRFDGPPPAAPDVLVTELPYDAAEPLRAIWHDEDFPGQDATEFHAQAREIRLALGTRVLGLHEGARPVGCAALNIGRDEIEIGAVYVLPEYRGQGTRHGANPGNCYRTLWLVVA